MCFLRVNVYFLWQSHLSVAQSGTGVCRFGRFNLRVHQLLEEASYGGLWADLQSRYSPSGRRFPAKHNCTLRLTHGSTHWLEWGKGKQGKRFSRRPQLGSQAAAGFTCPKEETTLKYEKIFWEDSITHKETLGFCCVSDSECVLYLIKCREKSTYRLMIPLTSITSPF